MATVVAYISSIALLLSEKLMALYCWCYVRANPHGDDLNLLLSRRRTNLQADLNRHIVPTAAKKDRKQADKAIEQRKELAMAEVARRGRHDVVKVLLEAGVNLNMRTRDRQGNTHPRRATQAQVVCGTTSRRAAEIP